MNKSLLIYDAKCSFCRNLARKIEFNAREPLEIRALSDPDAIEELTCAYPRGWEQTFYLARDGRTVKGVKALRGLNQLLGPKQLALILGEYVGFRLARVRSPIQSSDPQGEHGLSRRNVLKGLAVAPLIIPISKLPQATDPFNETPEGLIVNIAEVTRKGQKIAVAVRRCEECVGSSLAFKGVREGRKPPTLLEDDLLHDETGQLFKMETGEVSIQVRRQKLQSISVEKGTRNLTVHNAILDASRYNIGFSVGLAPNDGELEAATMAGLIAHDQPMPVVDLIYFSSPNEAVATHLEGYRLAIKELARDHRNAGRRKLAKIYEGMEEGFSLLKEQVEGRVPESAQPSFSEIVVTSTPELMRFVRTPSTIKGEQITAQACGCSFSCCCGCGSCFGCGCSAGFCIPPRVCFCGYCLSCGCGCGYCCGCDVC